MALRLDKSGTVGKVTKLPQGGIRVDAAVARTGVQTYFDAAGRPVYEYRPAEEVTKAESLATLDDAPVTDRHPKGLVTPVMYRGVTAGHVSGSPKMDGDLVVARLVIQDADLLAAIERGDRREVSCGYSCDLEDTPGTSPEGVKYDKIQRNIIYNHVAIVEQGRAGSRVALRLDSNGDTLTDTEEIPDMTPEQIAALQAELAQAKTDLAQAQARADAAEANAAKAQARADAAGSAESIATAVKARLDLVGVAQSVLGAEYKADAKTDAEVRADVIGKVFPDLKLDGGHPAYVDGLFAAAAKAAPAVRADVSGVRGPVPDAKTEPKTDSIEAKAKKAREDSDNAWRTPCRMSTAK